MNNFRRVIAYFTPDWPLTAAGVACVLLGIIAGAAASRLFKRAWEEPASRFQRWSSGGGVLRVESPGWTAGGADAAL